MDNLNLRLMQEQMEKDSLSEYAALSINTLGRDKKEKLCDIRTDYQRDRDRILHSKAFRRLMHKTQVFLIPEGDHYRTRLIHTLEVSQNARTIARALRLNEDLTEAIALGHDLGHTPFGHAGERALNGICSLGFSHSEQSVRVVEVLEKHGEGLNLTVETRDGIRNHRTSGKPMTLEGKIVRLSDKIAYINHDLDDAERANIIKASDIPKEFSDVLGTTSQERLNTIVHDIIISSQGKNEIVMSEEVDKALFGIRSYLFEHLYRNNTAKSQESKAEQLICYLYDYYISHIDKLPDEYINMMDSMGESKERVVCDYIAGMTDRYAINIFQDVIMPMSWRIY